jgi:hypothetical protein
VPCLFRSGVASDRPVAVDSIADGKSPADDGAAFQARRGAARTGRRRPIMYCQFEFEMANQRLRLLFSWRGGCRRRKGNADTAGTWKKQSSYRS